MNDAYVDFPIVARPRVDHLAGEWPALLGTLQMSGSPLTDFFTLGPTVIIWCFIGSPGYYT